MVVKKKKGGEEGEVIREKELGEKDIFLND